MSFSPGQFSPEPQRGEGWRLVVAVVIITALWFIWPQIFPTAPAPAPDADSATSQRADGAQSAPADVIASSQSAMIDAAQSQAASAPASRPAERFINMDSKLVQTRLSSWGAAITDFRLSNFKDNARHVEKDQEVPSVDLVPGKGVNDRSFTVRAVAGTFPLAIDAAYDIVEQSAERVVLRHDTGRGVSVTRTYSFDDTLYAFEVETVFRNNSDTVHSVSAELAVTGQERPGERSEGGFFSPAGDQMQWACRTEKLESELSQKFEQDKTIRGDVKWAGINRQYFLAAIVPREGQPTACSIKRIVGEGIRVGIEYAPLTIPAQQEVKIVTTGYFGPKQNGRLTKLGATVEEAIDFGWFGVISRPLLWFLVFLYGYVHNYGIAILLLTLVVKMVLLPVTQKSFESAERMKKIQPLLKELQAKYKNDRMLMSQKQMELFKEHNVSPLGGCLPMLLQMPIWFALYRTLWSSVELYQQPFIAGWISDLAAKDPYYVLPIAVTIVMVVQQFFTPMPQDNPSMKYVMWGMPVMFGFIMLSLPSGLALYIFVNSVLTIAQQWYIRRKLAEPTPA